VRVESAATNAEAACRIPGRLRPTWISSHNASTDTPLMPEVLWCRSNTSASTSRACCGGTVRARSMAVRASGGTPPPLRIPQRSGSCRSTTGPHTRAPRGWATRCCRHHERWVPRTCGDAPVELLPPGDAQRLRPGEHATLLPGQHLYLFPTHPANVALAAGPPPPPSAEPVDNFRRAVALGGVGAGSLDVFAVLR
jgi:hypothetical protein